MQQAKRKIVIGSLVIVCLVGIAVFMSGIKPDRTLTVYGMSDTVIYKNMDGSLEQMRLHSETEETYSPADRKWQGIPQIAVTNGGRIWAAWFSGGTAEPNTDNYVILSYSDDGINFIDPFIVIDYFSHANRCFDPILWLDPETNELWVWYGVTNVAKFHFKITNPDAKPEDIAWTDPIGGTFLHSIHGITILDNGEWLFADQESASSIRVVSSMDNGETWTTKARIPCNSLNKTSHEAQLVQTNGGEIWLLARIDSGARGGIERWISYDGGNTFLNNEFNMDVPLQGPGSKFAVKKLQSGNLLFVNNGSASTRTQIVAYLSEDDGKTWPYSLTLDSRNDVSYPEIAEDTQGNIYVVWDKGRYSHKEIRYSRFTENDIKEGVISSKGSADRIVISKLNTDYLDMVSVDKAYDRVMRFTAGKITEDAIIDMLPKEIKGTFEDGESLAFTGKWRCVDFDPNVAGTYYFTFSTDNYMPVKYSDTYELFKVAVIIEENSDTKGPSRGCKKSSGGVTGILGIASILLIKKRMIL